MKSAFVKIPHIKKSEVIWKAHIKGIAYMDDTVWAAKNKEKCNPR
jgi:hypothetical protein